MTAFEYFQKRTDERLESIEDKVDQLLAFKHLSTGKVIGFSAVVGGIVSLAVAIIGIYFGAH